MPEKNVLICPFKNILKKFNSILTILSLPFEFEQYRQRKMALGTNGLSKFIVRVVLYLAFWLPVWLPRLLPTGVATGQSLGP